MKKLMSVVITLISFNAYASDLALSCKGEFITWYKGYETASKTSRSFVFDGTSAHYMGNVLKCDDGKSHTRCFKTQDQKTSQGSEMPKKWTIELDKVTGKLDYQFTDLWNETVERFRGSCTKVSKVL
jgi:hypothetical protein